LYLSLTSVLVGSDVVNVCHYSIRNCDINDYFYIPEWFVLCASLSVVSCLLLLNFAHILRKSTFVVDATRSRAQWCSAAVKKL